MIKRPRSLDLNHATFLRQSGVLLLGQVGAVFFACVFTVLAARWLGPVEFGVLSTANTLVLLLSRASGPLTWIMTNVVAHFDAAAQPGKLRFFVAWAWRRLIAAILIGLALAGWLSFPLSRLLRLSSPLTIILTALWFAALLMTVFARAVQQGLQAFGLLALNQVAENILRLIVGLALIALGLGAQGGIVGYATGAGLAALIALMSLARHLGQSPPDADVNFRSLVTFSAQAVIAAGCYAILSNADFLTIKRFLPETDAGLYAAVQTLGLLPMVGLSVFYNVMFSTVSFAHARGDETLTFFYRLLAAIALMGAVTVALTGLLARPLILLAFGASYLAAEPLLVGYMAATMVLVLVMVFNSFYLARREGHFIPWLAAGTIVLVALLVIHHDTAQAIVVDILLAYSAILTAYVFQAAVAWLRARSARIDRASGQ